MAPSTGLGELHLPTHELQFTKPALNGLPAARSGGRDYYNDAKVPGLQLIVTDSGKKSFYLYAWFRGKPKRFRIGGYPDITPEHARKLAAKMRGDVAQDRDPLAERTRERVKGATLREAFEVFLKTRRKLKPNTVTSYRKYLQTVFGDWLDRPFVAIARDGIATRHAQVTEGSGPAHADNAMRTLRAILNFAPARLKVPREVRLQNVDLSIELETLSFYLAQASR